MNNKISLKGRLVAAVLALVMLVTSLLGTTFAWFTDSATSGSNVITAGRLDVNMYWSDTLLAVNSTEWKHADGVDLDVFSHENWEPGYTEVKYVKIANEGSLDLKWQLSLEVEDEIGKLAEVIDVYYVNPATSEVTSLAGLTTAGTLDKVISSHKSTSGTLLEEDGQDSVIIAIAMHMQESAGNEYQAESVSGIAGFKLHLVATQYNSESDSFGSDYDKDATFPTGNPTGSASVSLAGKDANNDGLLDVDVPVALPGGIVANIPAGTKLADGATQIDVSVDNMATSSNIQIENDEEVRSINVHAEGVAEDNTVPAVFSIPKTMPVGLNIGNYRLYHVEDGNANQMNSTATPTDHNDFYYDPATGDMTVAMATYSEVALVAEPSKWEGNFDYSWYTNATAPVDGEAVTEYTIANADQLAAFGAIVGGMDGQTQNSFAGKTVKLIADVNLGDEESENNSNLIFYPIGYYNSTGSYEKTSGGSVTSSVSSFEGTFDGNGNTIANFYQNTWEMFGDYNDGYSGTPNHYKDAMGLFGYVLNGTVKNLTVSNFSSDGEFTPTGVIAAYSDGNSTFENIAITNCNPRVYNTGNGGIIGIAGDTSAANDDHITLKNITVDNSNKISALWGSWDVACGGLVGMYRGNVDGSGNATGDTISFENCHVSAIIDVYNDVCANYQYYAYRYSGMIIGSVRHNTKNTEGKTIPNMTGISATGCTVNYGDWNDYYYCEFEKNTMASYSPDYQFSRVPHSELNFTDSNGNGVVDADERASVTGCKHTHTAEENHQAIYLPFHQLFTGYSWGVSSIGLKEYSGIVTDLGIQEGDQEESVVKFENKGVITTYRPGQTISVGDLFKEIAGIKVPVVSSSVHVSVSPATENDKGSATYSADTNDWKNGTITFANDCVGALKIVITDYFFCTKTVIVLNAETAKEKFTAQNVDAQNAYTQITLDKLFTAIGVKQDVTATVLVDGNAFATINGTAADWASKTIDLTKDGKYTVTIKENDDYCEATTVEFTVNKVDKFTKKFTQNFLYRVGNANTVAWTSLFDDLGNISAQNLKVTVDNVKGDAAGTFNNGAIQFTGTGVVKVTISADGANSVQLQLEVVNATNVPEKGTIANYSVSSVLLGNTTLKSLYLSGGATLYGNGFTIDCTNAYYHGSGSVSENYIIALVDAHLDNVKVIGKVYTEYGAMASSDYNRALVVTKGNSTITNCYLSNTASPIRMVEGSLYVKGTTVKGGNFANIDVRNGHLTVENVTTINQALGNDKAENGSTVIGLGIVVYYENVDASLTSVTVNGTLMQYNHISSEDKFSHEYATQLVNQMMTGDYADFRTEINGVKWVNAGIIAMTDGVVPVDNRADKGGYIGKKISFMSYDGYVLSVKPTQGSVAVSPAEYVTLGQGAIAPTYNFDYTNKNYVAKTEGSNDYCYYDNGKVLIAMDQGDTFNWDPFILTATKYGTTLNYTVTMNGTTYTSGQKIAFNESGEYVITYTYTDSNNYTVDEDGNLVIEEVSYTKTVTVSVSVVQPTAKNATFTFSSSNTATEKLTVNNKTYISAKGVSATDKQWGYITVNGTKVFYPIIEAQFKKATLKSEYTVYYYVFNGTVTITDHKDGGTGAEQIYNASTTTMPTNLTVVNGMEAKYTAISSACVDISKLTKDGPSGEVWDFSSSSTVSGTTKYNGYLAHQSPSGLAVKSGTRDYDAITVAQFSYTDAAGATYYYFVGYFMPNQNTSDSGSSGGSSPCVTPDTLVTLADGTQKRIDQVTYNDQLLVWDFYNGKYAVAPSAIIFNHGYAENTIIKLNFSDGTVVKVANMHQFFDNDLNRFVTIDAESVVQYVGHNFAKRDGGKYTTVTLDSYEVSAEYEGAYGIITAFHYNIFVEGMISTDFMLEDYDLFNYFAFGEDMKFDSEQMQADIDKYGLYTYDDFADHLTYEQFVAFNVQYFKIPVEKGLYTYEGILALIDEYLNK